MKELCKCDKCGKEKECNVEEFIFIHEGSEPNEVEGKTVDLYTMRYITEVTCRICNTCINKRKFRFLLFAAVSVLFSLIFFITGKYIEFGFVFVVVAAVSAFHSTARHEMEYIARLHYKTYREKADELILHPKMVAKVAWKQFVELSKTGKFKIINYNG